MQHIYDYMKQQSQLLEKQDVITPDMFVKYNVKRGLRDLDGTGVLTGLTHISSIKSKEVIDGKTVPCRGKLTYRGYNIYDLIRGIKRTADLALRRLRICCCLVNYRTGSSCRIFRRCWGICVPCRPILSGML